MSYPELNSNTGLRDERLGAWEDTDCLFHGGRLTGYNGACLPPSLHCTVPLVPLDRAQLPPPLPVPSFSERDFLHDSAKQDRGNLQGDPGHGTRPNAKPIRGAGAPGEGPEPCSGGVRRRPEPNRRKRSLSDYPGAAHAAAKDGHFSQDAQSTLARYHTSSVFALIPSSLDGSKGIQRRDQRTELEGGWTREEEITRGFFWGTSRARCVCTQELLILVSPTGAKIAFVPLLVPHPPFPPSCFYFLFRGFAVFPRSGPSLGCLRPA